MKYVDTAERNRHYHCLEYDHDQPGELYLIASGVERCDPGAVTGPDIRDGWHLHVMLSGCGTLRTGGKELHPHMGQMFLLKHGEEAWYQADMQDPWSYCWVTCNGTETRKLMEQIGFKKGIYCLDLKTGGDVFYDLIGRLHRKPELGYTGDLMRRGILLEFLSLAMENSEGKKPVRSGDSSPEAYVRKAVDFIHYNYATIDVSDIVRYIGFTRSYFTTIFRRVTGISPQEYLIQYRMRKSRELLLETDLKIEEIATRVGYENPLSLTREFRKNYGISPGEYRRKHMETDNTDSTEEPDT